MHAIYEPAVHTVPGTLSCIYSNDYSMISDYRYHQGPYIHIAGLNIAINGIQCHDNAVNHVNITWMLMLLMKHSTEI